MSEIIAYQKILFPSNRIKNSFAKRMLAGIGIAEGALEKVAEHAGEDDTSYYLKYIGSDYDALKKFWSGCVKKHRATIFSAHFDDHTGVCIFDLVSKELCATYEEHEDFELPEDEIYRVSLVDTLDFLIAANLGARETKSEDPLEPLQYPAGTLPPMEKFKNYDPSFSSVEHVEIFLTARQFVSVELLLEKLRDKGWHYILAVNSARPKKDFLYFPSIIASKEHNPEMEAFMKKKVVSTGFTIKNTLQNAAAYFMVYENFALHDHLVNEFGEEEAQEHLDGLSSKVLKVLEMSRCFFTLRTSVSDVSRALGMDICAAIGAITPAIECDSDLDDYCVL